MLALGLRSRWSSASVITLFVGAIGGTPAFEDFFWAGVDCCVLLYWFNLSSTIKSPLAPIERLLSEVLMFNMRSLLDLFISLGILVEAAKAL